MAEIMRSSSSSSNWAYLCRDLIDSILDRLVLLSDSIRFSAVCKSWNSMALNHYKEKRIPQINHQLPWLVIQPGEERDYSLYDVSSSKICNFQLQNPFLHREYHCCGSSHGWFFVWNGTALKMFNPISGSMFDLPPFIYSKGICTPKRVTLSKDPSTCLTSPIEFEVLAYLYPSNVMAHWKSGDEFWSYSERIEDYKDQFRFHDFIFYKHRMLGIGFSNMNGSVVDVISIDIDNTQILERHNSCRIKIKRIASTPGLEHLICAEGYLVETTKGDLLMVLRNRKYWTEYFDSILFFEVNKLIISSNEDSAKIIPATNLDGESLFLGKNNHSISVLASNYHACIPNSIYYATTSTLYLDGLLEVFNVEDGCVSSSVCIMKHSLPWIVPSMKM